MGAGSIAWTVRVTFPTGDRQDSCQIPPESPLDLTFLGEGNGGASIRESFMLAEAAARDILASALGGLFPGRSPA